MTAEAATRRSCIGLLLSLFALQGCAVVDRQVPAADRGNRVASVASEIPEANPAASVSDAPDSTRPSFHRSYRRFRELGRKRARALTSTFRTEQARAKSANPDDAASKLPIPRVDHGSSRTAGLRSGFESFAADGSNQAFRSYGEKRAAELYSAFFKGRYNRSRARLPENAERWRSEPDIANPGPDLANFPNSAFTLPAGRAYIELSPLTYYGTTVSSPAQYNAEFLLRYGLTDDVELRLFGNGPSWQGGRSSGWGFSPIAFDTKIQLWLEKPDYYLPAAGLETYLQTTWLGNTPFNGGTQPSFMLNFDQSLPFEIDLEYNFGATRIPDSFGDNLWEFSFQWALQRDFFDKDFALFIHGFLNNAGLPRIPQSTLSLPVAAMKQNAVGAGFLWTVNRRLAVYGQVSGGTTKFTPQPISMMGFALSF